MVHYCLCFMTSFGTKIIFIINWKTKVEHDSKRWWLDGKWLRSSCLLPCLRNAWKKRRDIRVQGQNAIKLNQWETDSAQSCTWWPSKCGSCQSCDFSGQSQCRASQALPGWVGRALQGSAAEIEELKVWVKTGILTNFWKKSVARFMVTRDVTATASTLRSPWERKKK